MEEWQLYCSITIDVSHHLNTWEVTNYKRGEGGPRAALSRHLTHMQQARQDTRAYTIRSAECSGTRVRAARGVA